MMNRGTMTAPAHAPATVSDCSQHGKWVLMDDQKDGGRMPGLAAYTRLRFSEGQDQVIFVAWK